MGNKFIYGLGLLLVFGWSCSPTDQIPKDPYFTQNTILLQVDENFPDKITHPDSIFKSITFLPLETREECLIQEAFNIQIRDSLIFINDQMKRLLIFDQKGLFIRQIGSRGEGPGEYIHLADFYLEDSTIVILDFQKLHFFSLNGEHQSSVSFDLLHTPLSLNVNKFYPSPVGGYYFWGGTVNITDYDPNNNRYMMYKVNNDLEVEEGYFLISHATAESHCRFKNYKDTILIDPTYKNYNIYQIDSHGEITSRYYYDFGRYAYTEELPVKSNPKNRQNTHTGSVIGMRNFLETECMTLVTFPFNSKTYHMLYSKRTGKQYYIGTAGDKDPDEMRFWGAESVYDTRVVSPIEMSWIKGEMERMSPEYVQKLGIEHFKDLDEGDNPVLIFYEFRDDI